MKLINNLYRIDTPPTQTGNAPGKAATAAAKGASPAISLSDLSTQLHHLESKLSSEPGFDAARVEQIKGAIRDGSYQVNTHAVADKVIQSIREMAGIKTSGNA